MAKKRWIAAAAAGVLLAGMVVWGAGSGKAAPGKTERKEPMSAATFAGLELRSIGPAFMSGRIADFAVDPRNPKRYFAAAASGGVWLTENDGTTWRPVFDAEGSYSIGCLALDPNNPYTVWVGTGENNSQRSVGYGDGVYRSLDGGRHWQNMGLKNSQHIGRILVDPKDSNVVYVAAQGPLWSAGGDRGLYKTTDGGKSWKAVLTISENTGVTDVAMDPRDPRVLYAASYQRRRHVWGIVDGGPESAIYKSTDAGATWRKIVEGLPKVDLGRIGLAVSPVNPDVVYAIVEAADGKGGFFRSTDRGESWERRSDYQPSSPMYYNKIYADPKEVDRVYSMDTWMRVTDDGGKSFRKVGEHWKHVDNHALWIDPADTGHLLAGCDGGVYETYDGGATWAFKANLPVTQFYRVAVDDARPFYNVYGGTQDNNTEGGPSRTISDSGIVNSDWFVTVGGDGFWSQVDPQDPDTVYSEAQYGGLVRFDRKTGQMVDIQPQPAPGDPPLRWNWNAPLIISPHSHTRLYFAAQRVFCSDDEGQSWRPISGDLTRQIDRDTLPMMGRVWSVDAVGRNDSTSFYGNIVALAESPLKEGLLYAGTDDGLIQVTEDGGAHWRKVEGLPGVPDRACVSCLLPSLADAKTVYAAFDNHKMGDFKPYLLKSSDAGRTWSSLAGNLPERGTVYSLAQDQVKPDLLFAGTEFGLFFTVDGGRRWIQLKGGMPTIAVFDLAIQRRESDLVVGTFGRGIFILDDYSPLRMVDDALLKRAAELFPVKKSWVYIPSEPLGLKGKANQGDSYFTAPNPPFGAVFTYYLKEGLKSLKEQRQEAEKKEAEAKRSIPFPSWSELRAEDQEQPPQIILTVRDERGDVVRRVEGPVTSGFHRVAWDLRYPPPDPPRLEEPKEFDPWASQPLGPLAAPGTYTVSLAQRVNGADTPLGQPQTFTTVPLGAGGLDPQGWARLQAFERKVARLQGAVLGAVQLAKDTESNLSLVRKALASTPSPDAGLVERARELDRRLHAIQTVLTGDTTLAKRNEPTPPSIVDRVQGIVYGQWTATSAPTKTHEEAYAAASEAFAKVLPELRTLVEVDLKGLQEQMTRAGAPWTPGRVPAWQPE